jgi:short subunit dehydrogenase-like uncharacterized protein
LSDSTTAREFDVIVWGATGFTGTLVAEYLLRQYGSDGDLRWAIAGRSLDKLDELRDSLDVEPEALETIVADSFDTDSLEDLASRTRVVITTVGPYALYGSALVEACVEAGTHYCDLAGEVQWIRAMIDQHHRRAKETGARIVHCCITMLVKATKGAASGGTIASVMNILQESSKDRDVARVLVDPYSLNPEGEREGPDGRDQQSAVYCEDADSWTAPFVMAMINCKVVRRSHALLGYPYGKDFRYREAVMTGDGVPGYLKSMAMTTAIGSFMAGGSWSPTRKVLQAFMPAPGEGPDRELRQSGFFKLMQIGELADGTLLETRITGDQDPGYGSTSKMLSECAVCLAKNELDSPGGILTPASAMARPLLDRLQDNAGLSFELLD